MASKSISEACGGLRPNKPLQLTGQRAGVPASPAAVAC
jgi:hypothetical protein